MVYLLFKKDIYIHLQKLKEYEKVEKKESVIGP